jgi:hypothetical protein
MDAAALQATLEELAADYTKRLGLRVETVAPGEVTLTLPVTPELVHAGGVLCGQAILAAADTAMLLALIAQLGEFRPMTTVQLPARIVLRTSPSSATPAGYWGRSTRFCTSLLPNSVRDVPTPAAPGGATFGPGRKSTRWSPPMRIPKSSRSR